MAKWTNARTEIFDDLDRLFNESREQFWGSVEALRAAGDINGAIELAQRISTFAVDQAERYAQLERDLREQAEKDRI